MDQLETIEKKQLTETDMLLIREQVVKELETCFDPEIPVNIYELGLIYNIIVTPEAGVSVTMTLTSPACPSAQDLPVAVARKIKGIPGVDGVSVDVVFEPPWTPAKMTEQARMTLGMDF